ncbi:MAG TPA: hypothetical protein VG943_03235 [Caulobacterales bacterium]|nr:hypothetical protein [Caulobacterales bacterium]
MFLRSAALACASVLMFSVSASAIADTSTAAYAPCEEATFRIYFNHDDATLTPMAVEMLNVASARVAGCSYSELHVAVDASSPYAAARGQAIIAAARSREWNVARIEPQMSMRVAHRSGPDYAEVTMTPRVLPTIAPTPNSAGV